MKKLAVLKTVKTYQNQIIWEALYLDGNKMLENFSLREQALIEAFDLQHITLIKVPVYERNSENYMRLFPDREDFSYLTQITMEPLSVNQKVYIDEYVDDQFHILPGWVTVKDVFSAPNTNLIWEKQIPSHSNQIWFTSHQLPGVFYWNRLKDFQEKLDVFKDVPAELKERTKE